MRITEKQLSQSTITDLFLRAEQLTNAQTQAATGKKINKPSDDPAGMGQILNYRTTLSSLDQYNRNINQADSHIQLAETTLSSISEFINEAKGIAGDNAGGTGDATSFQTYANQVDQIKSQLLQLVNTKTDSGYLFGGRKTDTPPFAVDAATGNIVYQGDSSANADSVYRINENLTVSVHANGQDIFNGAADLFSTLDNLETQLKSGSPDPTTVSNIQNTFQSILDHIQVVRSDNASVKDQLDMGQQQISSYQQNIQDLLGNTENIDTATSAVNLQQQETAYEAAVQVAAKTVPASLLQFLS